MAELIQETARAAAFHYKKADIRGKRFERLTAQYPTNYRDDRGSVIWHCRCECGNEVDVPYNALVYCNMKSCGCMKREHESNLGQYLGHTNGTAVAMLKSRKNFASNSTGYRGVYLVKGKYMAKIVFQKKQYHLGKYDTAEEAARARKQAEEILFVGFSEFYDRWRFKADKDPEWAENNPIQLAVSRDKSGLTLTVLPEL